jgi:predicted DCC family thiol-disulfide oxidoreductase YuxK
MTCDDIQELIMDSMERAPSNAEERSVSSHLSACATCREFSNALRTLDLQLSSELKPVQAPPATRQNILRWVDLEEEEKAARLAEAQAEFRRECAKLKRDYLTQPKRWLDWSAWLAGAVAFSGALVWMVHNPLPAGWTDGLPVNPGIVGSFMAVALCVLGSFAIFGGSSERGAA